MPVRVSNSACHAGLGAVRARAGTRGDTQEVLESGDVQSRHLRAWEDRRSSASVIVLLTGAHPLLEAVSSRPSCFGRLACPPP